MYREHGSVLTNPLDCISAPQLPAIEGATLVPLSSPEVPLASEFNMNLNSFFFF